MGDIGSTIAANVANCVAYADKLLQGVTPRMFRQRPVGAAGEPVPMSHPAFIIGHLATYPARLLPSFGVELGPAQPPASYEDLFSFRVECRDDPDGTVYPPMPEITALFFAAHHHMIASLPDVPDATLMRANPHEHLRARFPTLADMTAWMMLCHTMMHLGQISAWRRCMGLGPAT